MTFIFLNQVGDGPNKTVCISDMQRELAWGAVLGLVWLAEDFAGKRITVSPSASLPANLGYSSGDIGLFFGALAVGIPLTLETGSPWPYFVLLVLMKTVYDIVDEMRYPRSQVSSIL